MERGSEVTNRRGTKVPWRRWEGLALSAKWTAALGVGSAGCGCTIPSPWRGETAVSKQRPWTSGHRKQAPLWLSVSLARHLHL